MGERRKFSTGRLIFLLSVACFFTYLAVWGITSGYAAKDEITAHTFATNSGGIGDYEIPLALRPNSIYTFKIHAFDDDCGAQVVQELLQLGHDSTLLVEHQWDAQEWNSCDDEGGSGTLSHTHIFEFTPLETGSYDITLNITGGSWELTVYEDLAPLRPDSFDFFMNFFCVGVVGLIVLLYPLVFFFAGNGGIPKFSPEPSFMELAVPGISAALGAMAFFLWTPTYPGSPLMGTVTIILSIPYILYIFVARRKDLARPWITEHNKGFVGFITLLTVGIAACFTLLGLIFEFITGGIYFTWFLLPVAVFLAFLLLGVWYWTRQRNIRLHLPHARVRN